MDRGQDRRQITEFCRHKNYFPTDAEFRNAHGVGCTAQWEHEVGMPGQPNSGCHAHATETTPAALLFRFGERPYPSRRAAVMLSRAYARMPRTNRLARRDPRRIARCRSLARVCRPRSAARLRVARLARSRATTPALSPTSPLTGDTSSSPRQRATSSRPTSRTRSGAFYEGGVYRRDVAGGQLELVALGGLRDTISGDLLERGAGNPSISGDGRFVVFSTGAALVPDDKNEHVDVYVRDMSRARTDPQAYDLVSARDGSAQPARYGPRTPPAPFRDPGADVAPGAGISDDGRKVVFEVPAVATDLPDSAAIDVPAGQVFVRDRDGNGHD